MYLIGPGSDCTDGEVRLTNGYISQEGCVEICVNGIWGGVCGTTGWTKQTAFVVCKQLGYVYSGTMSLLFVMIL